MDIVAQMRKFMEPKSVALIGVSRSGQALDGMSFDILGNLLKCGYQGRIYPINPHASEIMGVKAYHDVREVSEDIDLAVINLPRELVPQVVKKCIGKSVEAIIIVTQGFADANDGEGKQLQRELDELIKGNKVRIVGPNTFGIANAYTNFNSSYTKLEMSKIPIGLICQTGAFFAGFPYSRLIGKGIDLGNSCDVDFADGLEYFEQDDDIKVIVLHIEGMRDSRKFFKKASRVAFKKPIVALKTGRNERAAQAAQSHTGSLVGKDEIWDVALKQSGIIRVSDVEELDDMVKAFCTLPLMRGRRIGVTTWSGGFGIMGVDACGRSNLQLAKLSTATIEELNVVSPSWQNVGNPADIWPTIIVTKQPLLQTGEAAIRNMLHDPQVDAVLCIFSAVTHGLHSELCQCVGQIIKDFPFKPLVFHFYGPFSDKAKAELEERGKTLGFLSPDRAIRALGHLADYSEFRMKF